MINTSDLRKNNWVKTEYGIVRVAYTIWNDVYVFGKDNRTLYAREVEGIPISKDMVSKLFVDVEIDDDEIVVQDCCFEIFSKGWCFSGGEGVAISKPFDFIHELQNIYYWIQRKELKIEL